MKQLKGSRTAENLLKAFAGESQARMRYTFYAKTAGKEGYRQIEEIFLETAENERMHAKLYYKHLVAAMNGEPQEIHAAYPVALDTTVKNLEYAAGGEHEEWSSPVPRFRRHRRRGGVPRGRPHLPRHLAGRKKARGALPQAAGQRQEQDGLPQAAEGRLEMPRLRPGHRVRQGPGKMPGLRPSPGILRGFRGKLLNAPARRRDKENDMKDMKLAKYALADLLLAAVKSEIESQAVYSRLAQRVKNAFLQRTAGIPRPRGKKAPAGPGGHLPPALSRPGPHGPRKTGGAAAPDPFQRRARPAQRDLRPGHERRAGRPRFLPAAGRALFDDDVEKKNLLLYFSMMEMGHYKLLDLEKESLERLEEYGEEQEMIHVGP